jgi:hypothetical protein
MELVFELALNNREIALEDPDDVLKVLVVYENPASCNRALTLLHRVAFDIEGAGRIIYTVSKFAYLAEPRLSRIIAYEAKAADLVVIAAPNSMEFPDTLKEWISLWLSIRAGRPAALAVVLDAEENGNSGVRGISSQLAEVARLGGVGFFVTGSSHANAAIEREMAHAFARRNGATRPTL